MSSSEKIKTQLSKVPNNPGVYKYYNKNQTLIYVGKAKNLKKRVSSYFNKGATLSLKTRRLVSEIASIDYVVVNTEFDALLLENNLIKENQPKYNILLKDDKSFPFICISKERFPKIFSTRRHERNEGEYFGPYSSVKSLNNVLELLRKLYKIRTCTFNLSEENIQAGKFKICLEYHIKNCLGPCEGKQSEEEYLQDIQQARNILKGNLKIVSDHFKKGMKESSEALDFEKAQEFKEKLDLLDKFQSKTVIVNKKLKNVDVVTIITEQEWLFLNYTQVKEGFINISESYKIKKKLENEGETLSTIIHDLRSKFQSNSKVLLTNSEFDNWDENLEIITPQIGPKKELVNLSLKNVLLFKKEETLKSINSSSRQERVLKQLQDDLQLGSLPEIIECFDNSNIQGTNPVASMVCFKNGKPSKKDYRHYKIKTVEGPDDFKSMKEIVGRRYKRQIEENNPLPNLIIIDGGKGQLSSSCEALKELKVYGKIPIVGIAKKLEEIYYPEDSIPVHISKKSESLKLIQHLRDEAHRFAITFHRKLRSKSQTKSELDDIKGIGPSTKRLLLKEFKSVKKIAEAGKEQLEALIGKNKAKIITEYLQKKGA